MFMDIYSNNSDTEKKLKEFSDTMCFAKWSQVSLHLTNGMTHSCYHPPVHKISIEEIKKNPLALHNTKEKKQERRMMLNGEQPKGCSYCWKIEELGHKSDRLYRSNEHWALSSYDDIVECKDTGDINPTYVEVNFNQACNFKCMYCSPHLSTTWQDEIESFGPYEIMMEYGFATHNNLTSLENKNLMPIKVPMKDNPFLEAFWKWWPTLYKKLEVFRMTGGEPLMDVNTFKVLDYINDNPNAFLELSITSNFCPPKQELFDKFIDKMQEIETIRFWKDPNRINPHTQNDSYIAPALKHFSLFVSLDSVGSQAEYIRSGLDFERLKSNIEIFLSKTHFTTITFINTFNILSIPRIKDFLEFVLDLRRQYSKQRQGTKYFPVEIEEYDKLRKHPDHKVDPVQRIWFDLPILESPSWFNITVAPVEYKTFLEEAIDFMKLNSNIDDFSGFYDFEIKKLERNLSIFLDRENLNEDELYRKRFNLKHFITQYDSRKGYNFLKTFPEYKNFFDQIDNV